ncbi:unnamed protein product [Mytilus edulis]|uniref:Uncharacterized protein n=1 Tax=Mytilus edulis TaxID=6550 RepID=A0A8S3SQZ0_MYTED|nr:unnamed protein product [Mytilus edulis]
MWGEEPNPNLSSSDTSNASSQPYVIWTEVNQVHTNPNFIGDSGESESYAEYTPTTSINSAPTQVHINPNFIGDSGESGSYADMITPTTSINSDTPNFNNRMLMGNMQFLQQQQVTSFHSTYDNNDDNLNDENEEESEPDQIAGSLLDHTGTCKVRMDTFDKICDATIYFVPFKQKYDKSFPFANAHRIPARQNSGERKRPNPIIIRFIHYADKELFLSHGSHLAGKNIRIVDDLPPCMKEARNELAKIAYKIRSDEKLKTRIRHLGVTVILETRTSSRDQWHIRKQFRCC